LGYTKRPVIAAIVQIDFAKPLAPIAVPRCGMVWALVRYGRRPVGWMRLRRSILGETFTPDMQRTLAGEGLSAQVLDAIAKRAHQPPAVFAPSFSVVICTREHPELLNRQLESIAKLDYPNYEVIVVDNAPETNRTRKTCAKFDFVRYVLEPRKGLDFARNAGLAAARNEIVAYTDDDAVVEPGWLSALGQAYADPTVACVTGITFPLELATQAQLWFERYGGMQRGFERRVYRPGTWNAFFPLGSGRFGAGVNLSLRRETLLAIGGFDPALDAGSVGRSCGDLDIMARAIQNGGALVYEPAAVVWHQHRRTMKQLRHQIFDYGWGFCAYTAKYTHDLELGNLSIRMLRRWSSIWGKRRLLTNLKLALTGRAHFPIHLILLEIIGGIMGFRAYKGAVRHARHIDLRARQSEIPQAVAA
jgi:O-antigen biosynthesis protein